MPVVLDGPVKGFRKQPMMSAIDDRARQRGGWMLRIFRTLECVKCSAHKTYFLGV